MLIAGRNGHDTTKNFSRADFGPRELVSFGKAAVPQTRAMNGVGANLYEEYGRSGLRHWGGFVFEEWLQQLQYGRQAAEVYREMGDQDPIIGAILYSIQMMMRRVTWWCEPKDSPGAKWFQEVLDDMMFSWEDTLGEILSFLQYGYSWHEMVFKVRDGKSASRVDSSNFTDGTIGLGKIPLRSQDSLWKWVFDDVGDIEGMIQNPPPDYLLRFIPRQKSMHFRTTVFKDNPEGRSILRNAYRCFDPETELLTTSGWKSVAEVTMHDSLATLNDIGAIEYHSPTHLHSYDYSGEMVHIKGRYVDQMVTPNHKLYVKPQPVQCGYRLVEADKASKTSRFKASGEWLAPDVSEHVIPSWVDGTGKIWPDHHVPMDNWAEFMGIYLSEGHAHKSKRQALVGVTQKNGLDGDIVRSIVEGVGFPVYGHKKPGGTQTVYEITRGQVYHHLASFGKAKTKFVPDYIKNLSRRQIRLFLDAYHFGDGSLKGANRKQKVIYTSSKRMADDLMELAFKGGYSGSIRWEKSNTGFNGPGSGIWVVNLGVVAANGHRGTSWNRVPYKGKVHCVTVENHVVLARRNGKACWSGNSWWFIKNIQQIEAIGIERDLAGLPVLTPPEGVDIWDTEDSSMIGMLQMAKNVVSSIRRDEQEGVVLPFGWVLTLQASAGQRQFNTSEIISRYETRMATSVLADLVMMGQDKVGSYALSVTKKDMFTASMGAYLDIISSIFNTQCIPTLWELNNFKWEMPKLCHGAVETIDLDTLGNFINRIGRAGAPIDWETALPWMNDQAGIPKVTEGHDFSPRPLSGTADMKASDANSTGSKGE